MNTEIKIQEFGKLPDGQKFYLSRPEALPESACYVKVLSQKNASGSWVNAKSVLGTPKFVQYDKRVWTK